MTEHTKGSYYYYHLKLGIANEQNILRTKKHS
jgi:hypothetical protein